MGTGKRISWFVVALAGLALVGCGDFATYTPERDWSDGAQATLEGVDVARIGTLTALDVAEREAHLDATAQAAIVRATVEAVEMQGAAIRAQSTARADQATAQANERNVQATAAANDRHVQATEQAARATAEADAMLRATSDARSVEATAGARALEGTMQAVAIQATQQRQSWEQNATATSWAVEYQATAESVYVTRQAQSTLAVVQATRQSHAATATRQTQKREQTMDEVRDYGLPAFGLMLVLAAIVGGIWLVKQWVSRPQIVERSILGDAQPVMFKQRDGSYTLVDLDRQPSAALRLLPNGDVDAPKLRPLGVEERVTSRDQAVDGVSRPRLGTGHGAQPVAMAEPPSAAMDGLTGIRILRNLSQASTAGLLAPGQVEAIEARWAEED